MEHSVETLPGGTRVWTNQTHPFGTDSLLLAAFAAENLRPAWSACDLGAGCGILLLSLLDAGLKGRAVGVELDKDGAALLAGAAAENKFTNVEAVTGDLRLYKTPRPFDMVIANPPYYKEGPASPCAQRATARHEGQCSIEEVCLAAASLLKDKGRFALCFPPARLAGLLAACLEANLAPKRLQLVRKAPGHPPWLALLEARKAGGEGLTILPDHLLPAGSPLHY